MAIPLEVAEKRASSRSKTNPMLADSPCGLSGKTRLTRDARHRRHSRCPRRSYCPCPKLYRALRSAYCFLGWTFRLILCSEVLRPVVAEVESDALLPAARLTPLHCSDLDFPARVAFGLPRFLPSLSLILRPRSSHLMLRNAVG